MSLQISNDWKTDPQVRVISLYAGYVNKERCCNVGDRGQRQPLRQHGRVDRNGDQHDENVEPYPVTVIIHARHDDNADVHDQEHANEP